MPWYAVVEQRGEQRYTAWIVERGFTTENDARTSAVRDARDNSDARLEATVTTFVANDLADARNESIRRGLDWRLIGHEHALIGVMLRWEKYSGRDHDHCYFCWRKFVNRDDPQIDPEQFENNYVQDSGYVTVADRQGSKHTYWICRYCFPDFVSVFQWNVVDAVDRHIEI